MQGTYNTRKGGKLFFLAYKEKSQYIAVCLNLNIIEKGRSMNLVLQHLFEAAKAYLTVALKENYSDDKFNIPAPKKYFEKLREFELMEKINKSKIKKNEEEFLIYKKNIEISSILDNSLSFA